MAWFGCGCGSDAGPTRRGLLRAAAAVAPLVTAGGLASPAEAQATLDTRVINVHAHYFPESYLELLASDGRSHGADYRMTPDGFHVAGAGNRFGPLPLKFIDLRQRIADMDAQGVTVQAVSLTSPMVYFGDADLSERLSRAWNDGASAAHRQFPDRIVGLLTLPMLHPDRALRELERARALPGMRGVYMGTNIAGKDFSDPLFLPVFQAIEAAGLGVYLHPIQTVGGDRLRPYYLNNLLGNPIDTAIAASHLIFGGVMDKCPTLEVNLPHAGGVLPILTGRMDHGRNVRPELRHMARPPSDYLRRFTYDTIAHSAAVMRFVIQQVGVDRVTLGDDYCYDMGYDRPVAFVDELGLSPVDRQAVLGGNAARLLKI